MIAVPDFKAPTKPLWSTSATLLSLDSHFTFWFVASAGEIVALSWKASFTFIDKEVLPDGTNGNVWERHFNLDIVLCRGDEWFVIEMKYKTTAMDEEESERFGEKVDFATLKNQGATNYGMYGFWKDVRRIEIVKQRFSGVVGGIALFVTNDEKYWEGHKREDAGYANFSMAQGSHGPEMKWTGKCEKENDKKEHHEFTLEHSYNVEWSREGTSGFRYVILQVPPAEDK